MSITDQLDIYAADKVDIENSITTMLGTLSTNSGYDTFATDIRTIPMVNGGGGNSDWNAFANRHSGSQGFYGAFAFWGAGMLDKLHPATARADFGTANDKRISFTNVRLDLAFFRFNDAPVSIPKPSNNVAFTQIDYLPNSVYNVQYENLPLHIKLDALVDNPYIRGIFMYAKVKIVPSIRITGSNSNSYVSNAFSSSHIVEIEKLNVNSSTTFYTESGVNPSTASGRSPFAGASNLTTIRFNGSNSSGDGLIKTSMNFEDCPLSYATLYTPRVTGDSTYGNYSGLIQALYDFTGNSVTPSSGQGVITLKASVYDDLVNNHSEAYTEAIAKGWQITKPQE